MSFVVMGMKMPESCYYCGLTDTSFINCMAFEKPIVLEDDCEERRPDWCPLVALPDKHGRLVDADALRDRLQSLADDGWNKSTTTSWAEAFKECADMVDEQPTIEPQRKKGKWIPVTRIEEWHEEEGLVGFPPEVKEFPQCTIKWVDATEPDEVDGLRCSECDTVYDFTEARNWCSECGADMREPEDIPMEYFESGGR